MKILKSIYILFFATVFITACENKEKPKSKMEEAKKHMVEAGKNAKAAVSDIKDATKGKLKDLKADTEKMLNKAKDKVDKTEQQSNP